MPAVQNNPITSCTPEGPDSDVHQFLQLFLTIALRRTAQRPEISCDGRDESQLLDQDHLWDADSSN